MDFPRVYSLMGTFCSIWDIVITCQQKVDNLKKIGLNRDGDRTGINLGVLKQFTFVNFDFWRTDLRYQKLNPLIRSYFAVK